MLGDRACGRFRIKEHRSGLSRTSRELLRLRLVVPADARSLASTTKKLVHTQHRTSSLRTEDCAYAPRQNMDACAGRCARAADHRKV